MRIPVDVSRAAARSVARLLQRLAPPPLLTLSEWADRYRRLSAESSGEPGRWMTSRAEYQREMMDCLTDPRVGTVVLMTSARIGKTQACINNLVGFHIHQDPGNVMVVLPTEARGDEWVEDEFDPMVRDTPVLRAILGVRKSRSAKDKRKHKSFPGGRLYVVGANAPSGLAAKTIRVVCCDEIDRYPASVGREGDAVSLAIRRANTIWNRKIVLSSTPTIAGASRIEKAYQETDRRRFWVPCPRCGEHQVLKWPQVRWDKDEDGEGLPATAEYACIKCDDGVFGSGWTDAERWAAIRKGEWRAEAPFRGKAGFHLNELYSPWRRLQDTAADFLEATKGGVEQLKPWVNTALGEVWQEEGESPEWERLLERREDRPMAVVPREAVVLTAGVDNQSAPERLEWAVWAWAPGYESWLVDTGVLEGSPSEPEPWDKLAAIMAQDWPREGGGTMRVARIGIDTGGNHTQGVYTHLRRLRDPRLMPLKGVSGWTKAATVTGPTLVDITTKGVKVKRGLKLWTVAVDHWKAELYRRLWVVAREDGSYPPGRVHLPLGYDVEQVKQLVAEQLVTVKTRQGFTRQEWRPLRLRNEQLDMAVYARAALSLMGADRFGERFWTRQAKPLGEEMQKPVPPMVVEREPAGLPKLPEARPAPTTRPAPATTPSRKSRWSY